MNQLEAQLAKWETKIRAYNELAAKLERALNAQGTLLNWSVHRIESRGLRNAEMHPSDFECFTITARLNINGYSLASTKVMAGMDQTDPGDLSLIQCINEQMAHAFAEIIIHPEQAAGYKPEHLVQKPACFV